MPRRTKQPEFTFVVEAGEEMTPEELDHLAWMVAEWIFEDLQRKKKEEGERHTPVSGSGAQK